MEQQSQNIEQSNSLPIKQQQYKLTDQNGQTSTVRLLLMDQDFVRIQVFLSRSCWQINISHSQALKIHNVFFLNNSIEELFQYFDDCFKAKQVSLETVDQLMHLTFDQVVINKPVVFKITLKQIEMNIQQIIQEMSIEFEKMSTKVEEISSKAEGMSTQYEEKLVQAFTKIKQLEEEIQNMKSISFILMTDEKDMIYKWISAGKVVSHLDLLYRASNHGFKAQSFILRCDGKGPLVCLVRSQNQRRFGGYIHLKFQKGQGYVAANPNNSFLFSLDDKKQYLSNDTSCSRVYYSNSGYGFTMGGGHDLYLADNCNVNSSSYSGLSSYYGKNQGGNNQSLAGGQYFQVEEIEVFEIIYKQ